MPVRHGSCSPPFIVFLFSFFFRCRASFFVACAQDGKLEPNHADFHGFDYGRYTREGPRHPFHLSSAYESIGEPTFTNFTGDAPTFSIVCVYVCVCVVACVMFN